MKQILPLISLVVFLSGSALRAEELHCLDDAERQTATLYQRLQQQAYKALDARDGRFAELKTPQQIADYQCISESSSFNSWEAFRSELP